MWSKERDLRLANLKAVVEFVLSDKLNLEIKIKGKGRGGAKCPYTVCVEGVW